MRGKPLKATNITRVIGVADMTRAVLFYEQALGLEVLRTTPYWTDLTCGDGNLALQSHRPDPETAIHTMVIFAVADLDIAVRDVEAAGGALQSRHDNEHAPVLIAHVLDTENNVIQLAQPK